jgi:hypothetical protein
MNPDGRTEAGGVAPEPKLRFGIMCSGTVFSAWQARCIELLLAVPGVEPALLVVDARERPDPRFTARVSRLVGSEKLLWKAFNDGYVARRARAFRPVDLSEPLAGVPARPCRVSVRGKFSEIFDDADVDAIESYQLDFVLRFAFGIVRGRILDAARYGIWSFHHDDEARYRGGPPSFWEIHDGDAVTGVMLQRLTERLDAGVVLEKGHVRTNGASYARNTDASHFVGAAFPAKVCKDILSGITDALDALPVASEAPVRRNPTNRQMTRFLRTQARHHLAGQLRSTFVRDQWSVGVVDTSIERFLDPSFSPRVKWTASPDRDIYVADPFGVAADEPILVEAFDQRRQLGTIRALDSRRPALADSVLPVSVHASYPYLLRHRDDVYCVPELARSRSVRLFRAVRYPGDWAEVATLVDGVAAVDPTIVEHDGRWWMFFTNHDVDANAVLHLWHAPDLLGPWEPHASNPVKTDVRSARPAGTPFVHDGRLYRPAQDCSETYGGAVVLNEVEVLTPTRFSERVAGRVRLADDPRAAAGCHTLSAAGAATLVDGKRRVFARRGALAAMTRKLRRGLRRS